MNPDVIRSYVDILIEILNKKPSIEWLSILISVLSPIIVGIVLAIIGYKFEKGKMVIINKLTIETNTLNDKLEAQKELIRVMNGIEVQNKIRSMNVAIELYEKLYELYWNRVDESADISSMFNEAKRFMYEKSIFLENDIVNTSFKVLFLHARLLAPGPEDKKTSILPMMDTEMNNLKDELIREYNLKGIITEMK
jgi:hypothetical protein